MTDTRIPRKGLGIAGALLSALLVLLLLAVVHLTQGTSEIGPADLLSWLVPGHSSGPFGSDPASASATYDVFIGSRLPRLLAGLAVGFALGIAGMLFQSLTRNPLASPDTLAVTAGANLAVVAAAAFGLGLPLWASGLTAAGGGTLAAALVLLMAGRSATSGARIVLAGTAVAIALQSATSMLLILFEEETTGLFSWGNGSLTQLNLRAFAQAAPVILVCAGIALLLSRRLDLLAIGEETASVMGVPVRSTRLIGVLLAVVLTAAAVTLAGPIGFVGLAAPVAVRLLARAAPGLHHHAASLPAAGLLGAVVVIGSDTAIRAALGAAEAIVVPTGVTTTLLGALLMVVLARRVRDSGTATRAGHTRVQPRSAARVRILTVLAAVGVVAMLVAGLLSGHTGVYLSDLPLWFRGRADPFITVVLQERAPRVVAALAGGAALALAGTLVQAACRNPLAEPGILGITGGAGIGAVIVVTSGAGGAAGTDEILLASLLGALLAFGLVYALSWRGGLDSDRLLLVGIGCWYGAMALISFLLVRANPWDTPAIYTWLSGTTYGRAWPQVIPVLVVLAPACVIAYAVRRELDLLALDEQTPRLLGIRLERLRLVVLTSAAVLTAVTVSAVGVVAFVGLVAPHMARGLVGSLHSRMLPVAVMIGAMLLGLGDLLGRTVIAPAQIPAGLLVALLGAPYFVYLLSRTKA